MIRFCDMPCHLAYRVRRQMWFGRFNDANWNEYMCVCVCVVITHRSVFFLSLYIMISLACYTAVRLWKWCEAYRRGLATIMNRQICALNIRRLRPFCFASSQTQNICVYIEIVYWSESSRVRITKLCIHTQQKRINKATTKTTAAAAIQTTRRQLKTHTTSHITNKTDRRRRKNEHKAVVVVIDDVENNNQKPVEYFLSIRIEIISSKNFRFLTWHFVCSTKSLYNVRVAWRTNVPKKKRSKMKYALTYTYQWDIRMNPSTHSYTADLL